MTEIAWKEINKSYKIVIKRKSFKDEKSAERFIEKLFEKDNFCGMIAFAG